MEKRTFQQTQDAVSLLGFGCMRLPKLQGGGQEIDYDRALEMVDYAYRHGVNYFDTAYGYHDGMSETFIGEALKRYPRDSFNLATKLPTWLIQSEADVLRYLQEQLTKCQVDHFDYYLVHGLTASRFSTVKQHNVFNALKKCQAEGLVGRIGFSFHDKPAVLADILTVYDWEFAQIQLNYIDWDLQDAKQQYELIVQKGIQCTIMEPVRGGALAVLSPEAVEVFKKAAPDASVASWAIRYAASLPGVLTVLSGMSTLDQVVDNVATMTPFVPLNDQDYALVQTALAAFHKAVTVPCTACRYCMDCKSGVDIPTVLSAYNNYAISQNRLQFMRYYEDIQESARAHNCTACGVCKEACPQQIDIPTLMKTIAEVGSRQPS